MIFVSASSDGVAVNHVQVHGTNGEASIGPTSSVEAARTEENLNTHSEAPTVLEANGDLSPKDTAKSNFVADKSVQDHVMATESSLLTNGIRTIPDSGDHSITPIPLVNGYEKAIGAADIHSGSQNDIWSPATKLKRILEETKDLIVCPGVYDGFSARIALSVGFDTMYMVWQCVFDTSQIVERQSRADDQADGCRNHCIKIGHGRPGSSQSHRHERARRHDSKLGSQQDAHR